MRLPSGDQAGDMMGSGEAMISSAFWPSTSATDRL